MSQELDEAINDANEALYHLTKADDMLGHAQNWGFVDLIGGGLISTMVKRSHMSDAKNEIEQAKRLMTKLVGDLRDMNSLQNINIEMDDFVGFADYFFDGIIADWFVQSKIDDARNQVKNAIAEVQDILDGLEDAR